MKRSTYTSPQMKALRFGQALMFNVTSNEQMESHEEGGGDVLSKEYSPLSWDDSEDDAE